MNLTPKGKLTGFVAIEKPSDKFGPATYSCKVAFEAEEARAMKATIDDLMKKSEKKAGKPGVAKPPYVISNKQLIVTFKQKAEIRSKAGKVYEKTITIYDSKANVVEGFLNVSEGSTVRISFDPYMWHVASQGGAGVTLQLHSVQVIDLVTFGGGNNADVNPFDEVEGTFAAANGGNPFKHADEEVEVAIDADDGDF